MGVLGYGQEAALDSDPLAIEWALDARETDRAFEHKIMCYAGGKEMPYQIGPKISLADKWRAFRDGHNAKMLAQQMQNPN